MNKEKQEEEYIKEYVMLKNVKEYVKNTHEYVKSTVNDT